MNRKILLIFLLFFSKLCYAQLDTIPFNQFDHNGKKHGYWKTFIDSNLNAQSDTALARWYYFKLYYHGENLSSINDNFLHENVAEKIVSIKTPGYSTEKLIAINDIFLITYKNQSFTKLIFNDGFLVEALLTYNKYGDSWEKYDYSIKYNDNPYSYFFESPTSKYKRVRGFVYGDNDKINKTKYKVDYISDRYDADSNQMLFNGYYMGNYSYNTTIHNKIKNYTNTFESKNNAANLIIDTTTYFYEDYYIESFGRHKKINEDEIAFEVDSIRMKSTFNQSHENIVFRGVYKVSQEKNKIILTKNENKTMIIYKLTEDFYNPHIKKEVSPKPGLRIIAK